MILVTDIANKPALIPNLTDIRCVTAVKAFDPRSRTAAKAIIVYKSDRAETACRETVEEIAHLMHIAGYEKARHINDTNFPRKSQENV